MVLIWQIYLWNQLSMSTWSELFLFLKSSKWKEWILGEKCTINHLQHLLQYFKTLFEFCKKKYKKINLIFYFLCTIHIYLKHLNKIDVNSESDLIFKVCFH